MFVCRRRAQWHSCKPAATATRNSKPYGTHVLYSFVWGDKVCGGCGISRKREEFALKNAATGKRHSQCKECGRRRAKDHYLANHAAYIERNRLNNEVLRVRNARLVFEYLLVHPCVRCGECDPVVLEFNHKDARTKTATSPS